MFAAPGKQDDEHHVSFPATPGSFLTGLEYAGVQDAPAAGMPEPGSTRDDVRASTALADWLSMTPSEAPAPAPAPALASPAAAGTAAPAAAAPMAVLPPTEVSGVTPLVLFVAPGETPVLPDLRGPKSSGAGSGGGSGASVPSAGTAVPQKVIYVCAVETCCKRYASLSSLRAHQLVHLTGTKAFACSVFGCRSTFTLRNALIKHGRLYHPGIAVEPYVCLESGCQSAFPTLPALLAHVDTVHAASPPSFLCNMVGCEAVFPEVGSLVEHYGAVHGLHDTQLLPKPTDRRPFVCDLPGCGKAFSRPEKLREHIRVHTGEKPHVCPHCRLAFAKLCNLHDHMNQHRGLRMHPCTVPGCTRVYTHPSLLRRHLLNAHGLRDASEPSRRSGDTASGTLSSDDENRAGPRASNSPHSAAAAASVASAAPAAVPVTGASSPAAPAVAPAAAPAASGTGSGGGGKRRALPSAIAATAAAVSTPIIYVMGPGSVAPPLPSSAPGAPVPLVFLVTADALAAPVAAAGGAYVPGATLDADARAAQALRLSLERAQVPIVPHALFTPVTFVRAPAGPSASAASVPAAAPAAATSAAPIGVPVPALPSSRPSSVSGTLGKRSLASDDAESAPSDSEPWPAGPGPEADLGPLEGRPLPDLFPSVATRSDDALWLDEMQAGLDYLSQHGGGL